MSRYAFDPTSHNLLTTWPTPLGDTAAPLTTLAPTTPAAQAFQLARTLSDLSHTLWDLYSRPPTPAELRDPHGEGAAHHHERETLSHLGDLITRPHLPDHGTLVRSYLPVEENAHRVGRALHTLDAPEVTKTVLAEVQAETDAIERAERGDFSGRAQQALILSRTGASPVQVAAADHLLRQAPGGCDELFTQIDPTSAAIAAAHWLHAAATVTSHATGLATTQVLQEADHLQALPQRTPTNVLLLLEQGHRPYDVVTTLVRQALQVARGTIPSPVVLMEAFSDAAQAATTPDGMDHTLLEAALSDIRLTSLDPARPSHDLLEDLLAGIYGCELLFAEHHDPDQAPVATALNANPTTQETDTTAENEDPVDSSSQHFYDLVRDEAEASHDRLL